MNDLNHKLALVKHAGKLEQLILYGEIIDIAAGKNHSELFIFMDELLSLFRDYIAFDPKPPREAIVSLSQSFTNIFARIRNTSDIVEFDKYQPIAQQFDHFLTIPKDKARIFQVFGYMFWLKNCPEKSIHYLRLSLNILNDNEIHYEFPERYTNLGFVYEYTGDIKKAEKLYKEGLNYAKKYNYENALIAAYSGMGRLNLQLKKWETAIQYLEKNLAMVSEKSMNREMATIMVNLAIAYLNIKDYEKALGLNLQLDTKVLEDNDQELYHTVILNTGCCYSEMGEYSKARPYFEKANNYAQKQSDVPQLIFSLINLGRISKLESNPTQSLEYLNKALGYAKEANNLRQLLTIHTLIGDAFASQQDYANALMQFESANHITETTLDISASPDLARSIATCHEKLGDYQKAYTSILSYVELLDKNEQQREKPDEEIKVNKQINAGKKTHYLFSDSMSLISKELNEQIGHWLIGTSYEMQDIVNKAYIAAKNDTVNVMICGESGTGKELVARLIHHAGDRSKMPFVEVNSAVFTTSLAESALFGHKKGSYTGANDSHIGYFESADRGTLFLDEISEMPAEIQSMILRVLETKQIKALGSNTLTKVDFRLICASNHDIGKLTDSGSFRLDLFHRINALEIHLLPLRERKSDIPLLINYFLTRLSAEQGVKVPSIEPRALDLLCGYGYPGNIRELKNIIQRLLLFNQGNTIVADVVEVNIGKEVDSDVHIDSLDLLTNERFLIETSMRKSMNVVSEASKLLGISPYALSRRIKKYNMVFGSST
jgi:DNA-binding NtrC family response regulator/Tfp pilus assembly protein PilF